VIAAGGSVAPHRMHKVGGIRRVVVFCASLMPGRCAKLSRFVTDETGGSSICKRRGREGCGFRFRFELRGVVGCIAMVHRSAVTSRMVVSGRHGTSIGAAG
jgi:hypothetical protein